MKRFIPFFTLILSLFVYQNCGEYRALSDGGVTGLSVPAEKLNIRSVELKRFVGDSGSYYQTARVEITDKSMFMVIEESAVCQRSFQLGSVEQHQVFDFFSNLSYRQKGSDFPTENHLIAELEVVDSDGKRIEGHVITNSDQEKSIAPESIILEQSAGLVELFDNLLAKEYADEQSVCMSQQEIPRFVEYVWTDVVNNNPVALEGFWFESQSDGNVIFLSGLNSNFCYEAYLLNLHEQAIVINALSIIVLDSNTAVPVDTNGVRYIDYRLTSKDINNPERYYIDGQMAPANSQLLNNGEAITDIVLSVLAQARARYQETGQTPSDGVGRCVFQ